MEGAGVRVRTHSSPVAQRSSRVDKHSATETVGQLTSKEALRQGTLGVGFTTCAFAMI